MPWRRLFRTLAEMRFVRQRRVTDVRAGMYRVGGQARRSKGSLNDDYDRRRPRQNSYVPYLTATLTRAADYATAQAHREVGLEHLLLALTEDPEATVVMKASNVDLAQLAAEVSEYLGRSDDRLQPNDNQTTAISTDLRRILEAAAAAARQGRRREINGAIVLAAIVGDGTSAAANFLQVQGLTVRGSDPGASAGCSGRASAAFACSGAATVACACRCSAGCRVCAPARAPAGS